MTALILSILLAQAGPTRDELIGALNVMEDGVIAARQGLITPTTNAAKTRSCLVRPSGVPAGTVTTRWGVVVISPIVQQALGMALPPGATSWADATPQYSVIEIQAVPTSEITFDPSRINGNFTPLRNEIEVRASALFPACEIAVARIDDAQIAGLLRCACRVDATCLVGGSPAPIGRTLDPGTFSGAGCRKKPCFARFDGLGIDNSWPTECPR